MTNQNSPVRQSPSTSSGRSVKEDLARKTHYWYLEATRELKPESYNSKAQLAYDDLTEEQQFIDKYIADKLLTYFTQLLNEILPEAKDFDNDFSFSTAKSDGWNLCRSQILANYEKRIKE